MGYIRTYGYILHDGSIIKWIQILSWWRHQMQTFSALLDICVENSPVPGEFLTQRPVTRSFDVLFDLHLNKRLRKQWWCWWFETLSRLLWRHRNDWYTYASYCFKKHRWTNFDKCNGIDGLSLVRRYHFSAYLWIDLWTQLFSLCRVPFTWG